MIPVQPPAVADFVAPFAVPVHPCAQAYRNRLHPWVIIRQLPKMQRATVCRFRRRNEAEDYLKVLQRLSPDAVFLIIFEPPDSPESTEKFGQPDAIPLDSLST
jgi:hypothetical protein